MNKLMWKPRAEQIKSSNLAAFISAFSENVGKRFDTFEELYRCSIANKEEFWAVVWSFCEVQAETPYHTVLCDGDQMPGAKWFLGAKMNFAQNLLRFRDDQPAITFRGEFGERRTISYRELYHQVLAVSQYFQAMQIAPGDRICAVLPNIPETIICMLAAASRGVIWSSCSPDFGTKGVLDRFSQIAPKILIAVDGYSYNGKRIDCLARIEEIRSQLPSVEQVVIVPFLREKPLTGANTVSLDELLGQDQMDGEINFSHQPFDHPLYIMYSSGTTGAPKCIVHGQGGTLLQHLKELVLHTDLKRSDRIFYFTTCGWMMWNWLVSSLAVGATVVLYDGSPFYPKPDMLFDYIDEAQISVFGTSAKFIAALEKENVKPRETHRLSSLRTILSTGSPLLPESFDYVYRDVKADLCLSSISGGTDIISCFALGNPIGPVYRGELQTRGLGMDVHVLNEAGEKVVGKKGELVCVSPFPSMPVYFWNDADGKKYHNSYFDVYPNVWCHGDYVELTASGGMIIYGRSDAVLNPGGVRIGTAELYAQVEQFEEIAESVAVGQEWKGDERIVLFVKLKAGLVLDDNLRTRVQRHIRTNLTPRHVPAKILQVQDIPRTISGKISELAIKNIIHGRPVKNTDALANPQALDQFRGIDELQGE